MRRIEARAVWEGVNSLLVASEGPTDRKFARAAVDSRAVREGDLFFAIRGEREDGHDFVAQAIATGASGAVIERPLAAPDGTALFQVSNSLETLQRLAAWWRRQHDLKAI